MSLVKCEHCGSDVETIKAKDGYQTQCRAPMYVCSTEGLGPVAETKELALQMFIDCDAQVFYRNTKLRRSK